MRSMRLQVAVLAVTAGLLASCSATPDSPSSSGPASTSVTAKATAGTPSADAESTVPAPSPEPSTLPPGPGQGNAELAISFTPAEGEPTINYTLVCIAGAPAAESQHPAAESACAALTENPALLTPATKNTALACTEQYGGPQEATVTGVVDGVAVEADFARTNGCEISAWDAAKDVLGAAGGAV